MMVFSFLRFAIISTVITVLYIISVFLFKSIGYFIVTVPFVLLYLFKKIDALICYNILSKNEDSKIIIRTNGLYTLTFISEYNLSGLSYVKVPNNIEYVGLPILIQVWSARWPQSTTGEFFLRKLTMFKYHEKFYIDSFGNPEPINDFT